MRLSPSLSIYLSVHLHACVCVHMCIYISSLLTYVYIHILHTHKQDSPGSRACQSCVRPTRRPRTPPSYPRARYRRATESRSHVTSATEPCSSATGPQRTGQSGALAAGHRTSRAPPPRCASTLRRTRRGSSAYRSPCSAMHIRRRRMALCGAPGASTRLRRRRGWRGGRGRRVCLLRATRGTV